MIDNDEFFVGNAVDDSHAQRATGAHFARVHADPSRVLLELLAARLARDGRL